MGFGPLENSATRNNARNASSRVCTETAMPAAPATTPPPEAPSAPGESVSLPSSDSPSEAASRPEILTTISRTSSSAARRFVEGGACENPDSSTPHFSSSTSLSCWNSRSHCWTSSKRFSKKSVGVSETAFSNMSMVTVPGCCRRRARFSGSVLGLQPAGHLVVQDGKLANAGRAGDRHGGDGADQQPLAFLTVQPGQRRDAGIESIILVR